MRRGARRGFPLLPVRLRDLALLRLAVGLRVVASSGLFLLPLLGLAFLLLLLLGSASVLAVSLLLPFGRRLFAVLGVSG